MELYLHFLNLKYIGFVTTTTTWKYSVYEYGDYLVLSAQVTMAISLFSAVPQNSELNILGG